MTINQHLYHYTCRHRWALICTDGVLKPSKQFFMAEHLVWLTDLHHVNRAALGLTSNYLDCDRGEVKIDVSIDYAIPWSVYSNAIGMLPYMRNTLEAPPVEPDHWWVATAPIKLSPDAIRRSERMSLR